VSTGTRISIAAAASALVVAIVFTLLAVYPIPPVGGAFLTVGKPLGHLILEFAPDSFIGALAHRARHIFDLVCTRVWSDVLPFRVHAI
jgi:hypothetical protein